MKRLTALFSLLLCALFILPCTAAAETYMPGHTSALLLSDAWTSGKIIKGDVKLRFDAEVAALGLDEEDAAILSAILPLLDNVTIGLGAGKTEGGIRIAADAELAHAQGGEPVTVSAAANLDLYGISIESDLIPGQKVTSRWETLLAMAGMSDSDISMLLMLRDTDWETMLPQLISMAEGYVQMGLQYAQPYLSIITNWAAALPMTLDAAPAPEGYPAAASSSSVIVTDADLMNLAAALAEYLKSDAVVSGLCNMLIQEAYTGEGEAPTTAQLCDEIIAQAAAGTSSSDAIKLTWGVSDAGIPVYAVVELVSADAGIVTFGVSGVQNAAGHVDYALSFNILNADGTPYGSFTCTGEAGSSLFTAHAEMAEADTQIMGMEYGVNVTAPEGDLPSQKLEQSFSMVVNDGETAVQMIVSTTALSSMTIDGGEVLDETTTMDMYVDGTQLTATALETLAFYPDTEGFVGTYSTMQSVPQMGINAVGLDVYLSDDAYDPATTAALSEIAFETSSSADMDALLNTIVTNGQYKLIAAMQALPTEVLTLLMNME